MKSGIIIIDKPKGDTSQKVVSKVKKILNIKKAGHIGTLDPLATGVFPVLIETATKMSKYLIEHDKTYIATLQLGIQTETGDEEGEIIQKSEVRKLNKEEIVNIFKDMLGKQKQQPHIFSAVKVNGKKLYEYARAGEKPDIPIRDIEIYEMKLIDINMDENQIIFETSCSKGTYIRVLCEDIAKKLGTVGYMKELKRTKVDKFCIESAVKLDELTEKDIIPVENLCENYEKIELNDRKLELFLNGVSLSLKKQDGVYNVYNNSNFVGLGVVKDGLIKRDIIF